jgi:hypothetical protein
MDLVKEDFGKPSSLRKRPASSPKQVITCVFSAFVHLYGMRPYTEPGLISCTL